MFKLKTAVPAVLAALIFNAQGVQAEGSADVAELEKRIKKLERANKASASRMNSIISSQEKLAVHGFVSAGISSANTDDGASVTGGITDDLLYQHNEKFGLQVSYQLSEQTDIVGQILGVGTDDNFSTKVQWAYIGHILAENKGPLEMLKVRVGKEPVNTYLISDYFHVGYAYPWVTPPRESYSVVGGSSVNGADLLADFSLPRDWTLQSQIFVGQSENDTKAGSETVNFSDIAGINFNFVKDAWLVRLGYARADVSYDTCCDETAGADDLTAGYNAVGAGLESLELSIATLEAGLQGFGYTPSYAPGYSATSSSFGKDVSGSFSGLGLSYDDGTWLMLAEATKLKIDDTFSPGTDSGYVTLGYRYKEVTPFVSYSRSKYVDFEESEKAIAALQEIIDTANSTAAQTSMATIAAFAPGVDGAVSGQTVVVNSTFDPATIDAETATLTQLEDLQAGIGALAAGQAELVANAQALQTVMAGFDLPQETYSVGVRYDFTPGAAVKLQVDKITGFDDTRGDLENVYVSHLVLQATF